MKPNPSPAHEAKESAAVERMEHKTGKELSDERGGKRGKRARGKRAMRRGGR